MIWRASTSLRLNAKGLSLIFKDSEERAPTGVMDALGKMVIAHHPRDVQVFDTHTAIPLGIVLGRLEVEVTALATNLQVLARDLSVRLPAAVTALRTTAYRALRLCQAFLSCAMVARILDHAALRVRQKDLQAHIKANGRMRTLHLPRRLPRMPCSSCVAVSQTMSAYQCPSARKTRCAVVGAPKSGRCSLILSALPSLAGTCRCFPSSSRGC